MESGDNMFQYETILTNFTDRRFYRHTSVVVFRREVFYGQGINMTRPGQSHVKHPRTLSNLNLLRD